MGKKTLRMIRNIWLFSIILLFLSSFSISMANAQTVTVDDAGPLTEGSGLVFTVTLDLATAGPFTVTTGYIDVEATGGTDYDNTPQVLNFNGTAGEALQFTVTTTNDAIVEGTETFTVTLNASDPLVTDSDTGTGTITDNDTASVAVNNATAAEGSGLLFTVTLNNPVAGGFTVTTGYADVTATGGTDYNNTPQVLNFVGTTTPETQQFTVTTTDDATVEGTESFTVTLTASNPLVTDSDTGTGIITDNDTADVSVSPTSVSVAEGGSTDTYDVVLTSSPTNPVTITITPDSETTVDKSTLTFSPGNGTTPQTVTVTAVNDLVAEGAHNSTITHAASSSDPAYSGIPVPSVTANITDNDAASVTVDDAAAQIEGTGLLFTVTLDNAVSGGFSVTTGYTDVSATGGTDYDDTPQVLSFAGTPGQSQQFTVATTDDGIEEGTETFTVTLNASNPQVTDSDTGTGTISDNDTTASFTAASQSRAENVGTMTVTVQLSTQSGLPVTVPFTVSGSASSPADYTISPASSVNIPAGDTSATITITVVDDTVDENNENVIITMGTPTNAARGTPAVHTATITDNDTAGVTIIESGGSTNVTEGGATDTYTVRLTSNPTGPVTITINTNSQLSVNPSTLNISPGANATNPRQVTVTAVDDAVAEGNHNSTITHSASSGDPDYNNVAIDPVVVSIADNETAGVNVSPRTVDIVEGSGDDTYNIALTSEPTAAVTITVSPDSQSTVNPGTLTFDPGSGRTAQTVTVTAVDDIVVEGNHTSTISHSAVSADQAYNNISVPDVTGNIADNETLTFVTDPAGSLDDPIIVPEGGTASFTVRLSAQPMPSVTIDATVVQTGGDADISVQSGGILTPFDETNWDVPQTVALAAAEDPDGTSDFATITVSGSGVPNRIVTAREADDDTITVTTPNGGEVWISGTTRDIRWDSSVDFTTTVNIELLRNNLVVDQLALNDDNDGTFTWDIPVDQAIDFTYRIRVTATSDATIFDESDGDFTILDSSFDTDDDSIPDFEEMGPSGMDNFYDGNGDGIPDWQVANANVTSLFSFDGGQYVTFEADRPITNMQPFQPPQDAPQEFSYPYGFFSFEFDVAATSDPATVTMFLDGEIPDAYVKFGPTPDNFTPRFFEFTFDGTDQTGAQIDDVNFTVTLSFVDGLRGDVDIVANGTISDPGAPGVIIPSVPSEETGSDCFIATAAFGSTSAPYVKLLREFRDAKLLTNRGGQWFVDQYYRHSPPLARWLSKHDLARAMVRLLLTPLIVIAWILLSAPLALPLVAAVPLMGIIVRRARSRTCN
jgi:hypothetical protein